MESGANPTLPNYQGWIPIQMADFAKKALDAKAISAKQKIGKPGIDMAALQAKRDSLVSILEYLVSFSGGQSFSDEQQTTST